MSDRPFTHPNFGKRVRIELDHCEVRLIFTANTPQLADDFAKEVLHQLKEGSLNLTIMGKPTSIVGE